MTDKELRERALKVWIELNGYDEPGDCDAIKDIAAAIEAAYREGVEAMRDAALSKKISPDWPSDFVPVWDIEQEAARLLEATPNKTTREAIDEAERGEAATYNDAQTLFTELGLDEKEGR